MAVQVQTKNTLDGAQPSCTFDSDVVAGNLGVCFIRVSTGDGAVTNVTDDRGSTWTQVGGSQSISGGVSQLWYTEFASSGPCTVSLTGGDARIQIEEVSGLVDPTLDSTNQATGTSAAPASGIISPAVNAWLVAGISLSTYPSGALTAGAGWTPVEVSGNRYGFENQNSVSGGTYNGQFTLPESNTWAVIAAAFKAGGAPPPSTPAGRAALLGVGG